MPRLVEPQMTAAVAGLGRMVGARNVAQARQAALDVQRLALDLQLRYRPATEINLGRYDLWAAQVLIDAAAHDTAAISGDAFTLTYIRDRILGAVDPARLAQLNTGLQDLQVAALDGDASAAAAVARRLREVVAAVGA